MEKRIITNEMLMQYKPMVEGWISKSICKNWKEAGISTKGNTDEISLGNSGWTISDIRQYLLTEVCVALQNYSDKHNTKESTFIYGHLSKRVGSLMKKLTKHAKGYGVRSYNIEEILGEIDRVE